MCIKYDKCKFHQIIIKHLLLFFLFLFLVIAWLNRQISENEIGRVQKRLNSTGITSNELNRDNLSLVNHSTKSSSLSVTPAPTFTDCLPSSMNDLVIDRNRPSQLTAITTVTNRTSSVSFNSSAYLTSNGFNKLKSKYYPPVYGSNSNTLSTILESGVGHSSTVHSNVSLTENYFCVSSLMILTTMGNNCIFILLLLS